MRKQQITWLPIVLLAVCAGETLWVLISTHEPAYRRKSLSFWIAGYIGENTNSSDKKADEALKAIGTNAIPSLLRILRAHDSSVDLAIIALLQRQDLIKLKHVPAAQRSYAAIRAMEALRNQPDAILPPLIQCLQDPLPQTRENAAHALGNLALFGVNVRSAIPVLTQSCSDTNALVKSWSIWALRHIDPQQGAHSIVESEVAKKAGSSNRVSSSVQLKPSF